MGFLVGVVIALQLAYPDLNIIAVNVSMATLAFRSWTCLAVDNSYVASQEFEEKRLAHKAQRGGWEACSPTSLGRLAW